MAISKTIMVTNARISRAARAAGQVGIEVSYWRVTATQINYPKTGDATIDVYLGAFTDATASTSGAEPVTGRRFTFTAAALGISDLHAVTTTQLYAAILAAVNADASDALNGAVST
ncbi:MULTISPECIES: hypothetical protein [Gluconobacter]|uniref:hypothetical protein n=1 Tax=Gluconobacter TaxID=441 RepID=UPI0039E9CFB8